MSTTNQQGSTASQNGNQPIAQQLAVLKAKRQQNPIQQNKRSRFAWTGFSGKTLWDWLQLFATLAIPIVVAVGTIWFSYQQNETSLQISQIQHINDQQSIDDQQQETALKTYLDDMSTLLLTNKLRESQENDEVRQVARAKTLTVLHKLNGERKATLIQFLYEAQLINRADPIVLLINADLSGANLSGANLSEANLSRANLSGADLSRALLNGAYMSETYLSGANLSGANLSEANLIITNLSGARLNGADLSGAHIFGSNLLGADLSRTYLLDTDLSKAYLNKANLVEANLFGVDLSKAYLVETNLSGVYLVGANMSGANLSKANLRGADLSRAYLVGANMSGTNLQDIIAFSTRN